jgi:hypothetical protein
MRNHHAITNRDSRPGPYSTALAYIAPIADLDLAAVGKHQQFTTNYRVGTQLNQTAYAADIYDACPGSNAGRGLFSASRSSQRATNHQMKIDPQKMSPEYRRDAYEKVKDFQQAYC